MKMTKNESVKLHKVLEDLRAKKHPQIPRELVKQIAILEEKYMADRKLVMREIEKLVDNFIEGETD
jgi:hypothetical protein